MKFRNILLALTVPALAFLAACGGDSTTVKPKPTITFQTGAGFTSGAAKAQYDSVLNIGIRAITADKKLAKIQVKIGTNGGDDLVKWDTMISSSNFNYDYKYTVKGSVGDVLKLTIVAIDDNGESASQSLNITIQTPSYTVSQEGAQYCWNIIGANKGAYDLNAKSERGAGEDEALKDLKDMTTVGNPVFSKSWTSGNGTKFVRVALNDWNNISSSNDLADLWDAKKATATSTITNLAKDDYILVKTGQAVAFNIYLIRVDDVQDVTGNNDFVKFTFIYADI